VSELGGYRNSRTNIYIAHDNAVFLLTAKILLASLD
jgi:hypothetical protein